MELFALVVTVLIAGWFFYLADRDCSGGGVEPVLAPPAEAHPPITTEHDPEPAPVAPEPPPPVLDAAPCEAPPCTQASADPPCAEAKTAALSEADPPCTKVKTAALSEADRLAELLDLNDYPELALAVRERRVPSLCAEDRAVIACYAFQVRSFTPVAVNAEKLTEALVVVTTAGWGDKAETTLPGPVQPLMELK